jgi:hypothetical protein
MDIWQRCKGPEQIKALRGRLVRLVESQAQIATMQLVDSLAEQALLEELLEDSKPPLPASAEPLHYLLKTPFRYPPLHWGSRFGTVYEPSLFYGALRIDTAMAEAAYYRFLLWQGMASPPPSGRILSEHCTFEARYQVERGIQLQHAPFVEFQTELSHASAYQATQALGAAMRGAGVEAFEYRSARCPLGGNNVALFVPQALAEKRPRNLLSWLCETTADYVAFKNAQVPDTPRLFRQELFLRDGRLPLPA